MLRPAAERAGGDLREGGALGLMPRCEEQDEGGAEQELEHVLPPSSPDKKGEGCDGSGKGQDGKRAHQQEDGERVAALAEVPFSEPVKKQAEEQAAQSCRKENRAYTHLEPSVPRNRRRRREGRMGGRLHDSKSMSGTAAGRSDGLTSGISGERSESAACRG